MSCGLALAVSLLVSDPAVVAAAAPPPVVASAPVSVASEPLFADIVGQSTALRNIVNRWIEAGTADQAGFATGSDFDIVRRGTVSLAALDMQGHLLLKERGTDGDLKCILRGISEDMPRKVEAVETATSKAARDVALSELAYLLNDNVEVITAPPQPEI